MKEPILVQGLRVFKDNRGCFFESYKQSTFQETYAIEENFVQDNHSHSIKNTIRGMHYQWSGPMGKLVRVASGKIRDVIVDIRKDSANYGKSYSYILSQDNNNQLYVPAGFAHGFICLSDEAIVLYKCTEEYNNLAESGINPFDKQLDIDWGIERSEAVVSGKDAAAQSFSEYSKSPKF